MPKGKRRNRKQPDASHDLKLIVEKLNLSRLDTVIFSGILLPLSITSISLIVNWIINPPFRTITGLNTLTLTVQVMSYAFFGPLIIYAYAYVSDRTEFRLLAIKSLLVALSGAGTVTWALGAVALQILLRSKLPSYEAIFDLGIGLFLIVCSLFFFVVTFGLLWVVRQRLKKWFGTFIPRRVKSEKINLDTFLHPFDFLVPPIIFQALVGVAVVGSIGFYVLWSLAILVTGPLQEFWQTPFLLGWLFSILPILGFVMYARRMSRIFTETYPSAVRGLNTNGSK